MKIEHFCNQINVSGLFLFVCSPEVQKTLVCCKLYRLAGWGEHSFLPASCGIFWRKGGRQWCSVLKRWQPSCRLILQTIINHKKSRDHTIMVEEKETKEKQDIKQYNLQWRQDRCGLSKRGKLEKSYTLVLSQRYFRLIFLILL